VETRDAAQPAPGPRGFFAAVLMPLRRRFSGGIGPFAAGYPRQFRLLLSGMLIYSTGISMIWPFTTIYMRQRLGVAMSAIGLLLSLNFAAGIAATLVAGLALDRFGRKGVMVLGLAASSTALLGMPIASTLQPWVILMLLNGASGPLYRIGAEAMVADLIEPVRRARTYALARMVSNLGVAIGPAIGGLVIAVSYSLAFGIAAVACIVSALLILFVVGETAPRAEASADQADEGGYGPVLRDGPFLAFCAAYIVAAIPYGLMFLLMPVYAKENFGLPESGSGLIVTTNAAMVVLFQYAITRLTERCPRPLVLAAGSLLYALGAGSVAWARSFPAFLLSMIVLTGGEMLLIPTGTTLAANLAPPSRRGRYMSILGLGWVIAFAIAPSLGGFLNDRIAPVAIWYGGLIVGLAATLAFVLLRRVLYTPQVALQGGSAA